MNNYFIYWHHSDETQEIKGNTLFEAYVSAGLEDWFLSPGVSLIFVQWN